MLADLNHAINFYLYFLSADKFRSHFKDLVSCQKRGRRKKSDATSIGDTTQYTRASSENLAMTRL
jgi:gastrin-releasing peptide receptor